MKSLLNVVGRKTGLDIQRYIKKAEEKTGKQITTYCEPFSGGFNAGLTLVEKGFTGEVILNDLDKSVINFFTCLKEDWEKLFIGCEALIVDMAKQLHEDDAVNKIRLYKENADKYKQAASEYVYRKSLSMRGLHINFSKFTDTEIDFFIQSETLQKIEITNFDYKEILNRYNSENTFMLIDPPYYIPHIANYYRCDCSLFYHRELSEEINKFKGKFLLTYNNDEYINSLYERYNMDYKVRNIGREYIELYIDNI